MRAVKRLRPGFISFLTAAFVLSAAQAQNIAEPIDTETESTTAPTSNPQISDPEAIAAGAISTGVTGLEKTIRTGIETCIGAVWQENMTFTQTMSLIVGLKRFDGRGGVDTLTWQGPSFLILDGQRLVSLELIRIDNNQFDTVAVLREFIESAEFREVEIVSDWFDTIILDPSLDWRRTTDADFSIAVFEAEDDGKQFRVVTAIDAFVLDSGSASRKQISTGAISSSRDSVGVADGPWVETLGEGDQVRTTLRWDTVGHITPDLRSLDSGASTIVLDMRNEIANLMRLDLNLLAGTDPRRIEILADSSDRLDVVQSECWAYPRTVDLSGQPDTPVVFNTYRNLPFSVFAQVPKKLFKDRKDRLRRVDLVAEEAGFYHLSVITKNSVSSIDLENGAKDVLVIRNDQRLRPGEIVPIYGDPGLDEVWLAGTSGWQISYLDSGVIASTRLGEVKESIAFAPGIEIRILPAPPFITDPRLSQVPHYPGIKNQTTTSGVMYVTRGGYVRFSALQLSGKSGIDTANGIANTIEISSEMLTKADDVFYVRGDRDLDVIVPIGLTLIDAEGANGTEWTVSRADDETRPEQRVIVEGLNLQIRPSSMEQLQ